MYVKANQDCDGTSHVMKAGRVYDVKDRIGQALIAEGLVSASTVEAYTAQTAGPVPEPEPAPEPAPSNRASKRERRG